MKRAFLYGLTFSLIYVSVAVMYVSLALVPQLGFIYTIAELVSMPPQAAINIGLGGILVSFIWVSIIVIRAARRAPPGRTWLLAIVGWIMGFFAITVVGLGTWDTLRIVLMLMLPYL